MEPIPPPIAAEAAAEAALRLLPEERELMRPVVAARAFADRDVEPDDAPPAPVALEPVVPPAEAVDPLPLDPLVLILAADSEAALVLLPPELDPPLGLDPPPEPLPDELLNPELPLRPEPLRLPRICGDSIEENFSAPVVPVTRRIIDRPPARAACVRTDDAAAAACCRASDWLFHHQAPAATMTTRSKRNHFPRPDPDGSGSRTDFTGGGASGGLGGIGPGVVFGNCILGYLSMPTGQCHLGQPDARRRANACRDTPVPFYVTDVILIHEVIRRGGPGGICFPATGDLRLTMEFSS